MTNFDIADVFKKSLTGKGACKLTLEQVELLNAYAESTPYWLQIVEAFLIEPDGDRPMFEYSISGPLPPSVTGKEGDRTAAVDLFRELTASVFQEKYPVVFNVWFGD